MFKQKRHFEQILLAVLDLISIAVCLIIAGLLRYETMGRFVYAENVQTMLFVFAAMHMILFLVSNVFDDLYARPPLREFFVIAGYNIVLIGTAFMFGFGIKETIIISRLVFGYFLVLNTICMNVIHLIFKRIVPSFFSVGKERNVIIMANGASLPKIVDRFRASNEVRWNVVGVYPTNIDEDIDLDSLKEIPVMSRGEDDFYNFATQTAIDEVFIQVDDLEGSGEFLEKQIHFFEQMGVVVNISLDLVGIDIKGVRRVYTVEEYPVLAISSRLFDYRMVTLKRLMDIVGSIVGLVITAVVSVILVPLIKLESPGPVFFTQDRVGMNGRIFKFYKFRSMYQDAEERKKELMAQNEMNGLMFKMENDPRVTRVGKFIRKTSLDELPQFWNVLRGEMSLVGTRPPTVEEYMQYTPYQKRRISFKPGITGLWQVSGRSDIKDFDEVVKLDLEYIDNWSIWLDIKLIIQTVLVVLRRKGAR